MAGRLLASHIAMHMLQYRLCYNCIIYQGNVKKAIHGSNHGVRRRQVIGGYGGLAVEEGQRFHSTGKKVGTGSNTMK